MKTARWCTTRLATERVPADCGEPGDDGVDGDGLVVLDPSYIGDEPQVEECQQAKKQDQNTDNDPHDRTLP
jgi:hypothetical protein